MDDVDEDEDGGDDDVTSPQILLESFCLCNNCVMSGAVSAPGHFETKNYDGVSWCMVWHIVNWLVLDFADRHHMISEIEKRREVGVKVVFLGVMIGRKRQSEKPADKWFPMFIQAAFTFSRGSTNLN